jgi:hypothetical protein
VPAKYATPELSPDSSREKSRGTAEVGEREFSLV